MNQQRAQEIANVILQQVRYPSAPVFWSWGAHAFQFGINENKDAYLRFRVKGALMSGVVRITLRGNDTYTIHFFKGNSKDAFKTLENMYCDQLQEIIDGVVERPPHSTTEQYKQILDNLNN